MSEDPAQADRRRRGRDIEIEVVDLEIIRQQPGPQAPIQLGGDPGRPRHADVAAKTIHPSRSQQAGVLSKDPAAQIQIDNDTRGAQRNIASRAFAGTDGKIANGDRAQKGRIDPLDLGRQTLLFRRPPDPQADAVRDDERRKQRVERAGYEQDEEEDDEAFAKRHLLGCPTPNDT